MNLGLQPQQFVRDSLATINVKEHRPDVITYETNSSNRGFLVFSEMHYPKGWFATIDDKEVAHYRVNYALRGMEVPEGRHTIQFKFEPEVVKTGSTIALASNIILGLFIISGIVLLFWKPKRNIEA